MSYEQFFVLGKPCFYIAQMDDSAFQTLQYQLTDRYKTWIIKRIRGQKSTAVPDFFNESAAALQFPYYFGEHWNAFNECITDLDWLEGDAYLLMISHASDLLRDADDEDFRILLQSLTQANEDWLTPNAYLPRERQPTPFHVLFQCSSQDISPFTQRLAGFHVDFEPLRETH